MHPLGQLITDRMELQHPRWSLEVVVKRIKAAGHKGIGKSRLGQLCNDPLQSIKREVIYALADGIGVTPRTVANAVLRTWDLEPLAVEVTDSTETVKIDPSLSDQQKREVAALIREMRQSVRPKDDDVVLATLDDLIEGGQDKARLGEVPGGDGRDTDGGSQGTPRASE